MAKVPTGLATALTWTATHTNGMFCRVPYSDVLRHMTEAHCSHQLRVDCIEVKVGAWTFSRNLQLEGGV